MHVFIAGLYGLQVWATLLAYECLYGGPWRAIIWCAPLIISAAMLAVIVLSLALDRAYQWWLS